MYVLNPSYFPVKYQFRKQDNEHCVQKETNWHYEVGLRKRKLSVVCGSLCHGIFLHAETKTRIVEKSGDEASQQRARYCIFFKKVTDANWFVK